jgi:hypothetical protein
MQAAESETWLLNQLGGTAAGGENKEQMREVEAKLKQEAMLFRSESPTCPRKAPSSLDLREGTMLSAGQGSQRDGLALRRA